MKHLLFILAIFFLGCSGNSESGKKIPPITKKERKPQIPAEINYNSLDISIRNQLKKLDSIYGKTPYYAVLQNRKMFVVMKGDFKNDYYSHQFTGNYKYGMVDDSLKPILPCEYDKIYNPNLTILQCMEIKKGNKIGLVNFITKEILDPQFEYILPSSAIPDNTAYGFKNGDCYKIECIKKFAISKTLFSPVDIFKNLSFNVHDVKENLFYGSYNYDEPDDPSSGAGVVLTPSYIEHLDIMPEICEDIILPQQNDRVYGTEEMHIKTDTVRSVTDKIISFIVSFYNSGADGRGYVEDSKKVIVYNKEKSIFTSKNLNGKYDGSDNFCHTQGYKFINDSLIEVLGRNQTDSSKKTRYDYENGYAYKLITRNGSIKDLHSNRYYNFTEYFEINDTYFKGCFAKWMETKDQTDSSNVWVSEHLTMDDLDLMINEIYADYGMKFKTGKWQTYFSQFDWYHPQYDNVDSKLNQIDKKNIELIAKEKAKMKGKENDFVKKHKEGYWAAG